MKIASKLSLLPLVACAALLAAESAVAQNATGTLTVTASVPKSCRFQSGQDAQTMAFGQVDPWAAGPVDAAATFIAQCSVGTTVKAGLGAGQNEQSSVRRMRGQTTNTEYLNYTLYSNSGRTTAWPIATSCSDNANLVTPEGVSNPLANSSPFNVPVYGRVLTADAQNVSAQNYQDTVTVWICAQ